MLFSIVTSICRSWTLPETRATGKARAYDLYDTEIKYEPGVIKNIKVAYGTSSFEVPVHEYDTVHNQGLMSTSENAADGTSENEVPTNENTAYGINTNDGGPVYDNVD